jgi:predicted RNA-binding Zn-ribbon protein involved in translation (DUF1610 family)
MSDSDLKLISTQCPKCGHHRWLAAADRLVWLQQAGFLRRQKDPSSEIVAEMFRLKMPELPCPNCQQKGVKIVPKTTVEDDDSQWETNPTLQSNQVSTRYCDQCRNPIDPERLELFPTTVRCVDCQRRIEKGELQPDGSQATNADYCPRCGDFLQTVRNRSSLGAYRVQCSSCGFKPRR